MEGPGGRGGAVTWWRLEEMLKGPRVLVEVRSLRFISFGGVVVVVLEVVVLVVVVLEVVVACGFAVTGLLAVAVLTRFLVLPVATRFCIVDSMTEPEG